MILMIFFNTTFGWKDTAQFVDFLQSFDEIFMTKIAK
jgi:hypothetical protein